MIELGYCTHNKTSEMRSGFVFVVLQAYNLVTLCQNNFKQGPIAEDKMQ
jgi:hypothetical protein